MSRYRCAAGHFDHEDNGRPHEIHGHLFCTEHTACCDYCLDWLDDDLFARYGELVIFIFPEGAGVGHASCVANWLLGSILGAPAMFDSDDFTREEIAGILARAEQEFLSTAGVQ